MKYLKSYKLFEAFGVAEPTLIYNEFLMKEYSKYFDNFIKKHKESGQKGRKYIETVEYTKDDLALLTYGNLWTKMPISSMSVEHELQILTDDEFKTKYPKASQTKNFIGTGACYSYDEGTKLVGPIDNRTEHCIHLRVMVGAVIAEGFTDKESLMVEIESSITHELNHAYEMYNRMIKGKGGISTDLTWALDVNRAKIKKDIWKDWYDEIGYYLYWSENHEMNAMIQDAWPYVKKYEVDKMKEVTPTWKFAQRMIDFKAIDFKKKMTDKILSFYPDVDVEIMLKRIKNGFANQLIQMREDSIKLKEDKPTISGEMVKKMSVDQFLKFVENRVNSAGQRIHKKVLGLYALKLKYNK